MGPVFASKPAVVTQVVKMREHRLIIQFAPVGFLALWYAGNLDMTDLEKMFRKRFYHIAAGDLVIIYIELQPHCGVINLGH